MDEVEQFARRVRLAIHQRRSEIVEAMVERGTDPQRLLAEVSVARSLDDAASLVAQTLAAWKREDVVAGGARVSADLFDNLTDEQRQTLRDAFPDVDCPFEASGGWLVVQDRRQPERSKGGIYFAAETADYGRDVESIGLVVTIGPAAGYDEIGQERPGWPWFEVGDFVKLPRFSSNRQLAPGEVVFRHVRPNEVLSVLTDLAPLL